MMAKSITNQQKLDVLNSLYSTLPRRSVDEAAIENEVSKSTVTGIVKKYGEKYCKYGWTPEEQDE